MSNEESHEENHDKSHENNMIRLCDGGGDLPNIVTMNVEKTLFIIDDEITLLLVLREYLEQQGLRVFTFETIPDLENELKEKGPHAVLLDILMPQVSGIEILKKIKQINSKIPIIMMTGFADNSKRVESLRSGAYALLTKPFNNMEELYHTINNAMNHYMESIRKEELSVEVEERYRREKMNILELDFLKNLQHMIGETEDYGTVLKNASMLLKNFLDFKYFAVLLLQEDEVSIQVFPRFEGKKELLESIASMLFEKLPHSEKDQNRKVILQNNVKETDFVVDMGGESTIFELSTTNKVYGYAGLFRDVPFEAQEALIFGRFCSHIALTLEKIRLFNEIKMLSIHDGMTGVFNHAHAIEEVNLEIERAKRYNVDFSIILLDVDKFKGVNDSYGHLAGNFVLKRIARLIEKNLRTIDIIGRYGGDEFVVILPQIDLDNTLIAGERLRQAVESETFIYNDNLIRLTISLGIATYQAGKSTQALIKTADDNLYRAKKEGKNRISYEQQ
jgi:two-component system, cell cycle response regulator